MDIDFNLETLLNSKPKKSKSKIKYGESSSEESKEDLSPDQRDFEPEPVKKTLKKNIKKQHCTKKKGKKRAL